VDENPHRCVEIQTAMSVNELNDRRTFTAVVAHGGYSAASRSLGIARSKLSIRIQKLEDELSARLIERSTRNFHVTEIGRALYEPCVAILQAAEDARNAVISAQERPQGLARLGCPTPFVELVVTRTV
jgi:DNA-binding transcriptional LysR family regulator